jgi:hypothetical protein
MADTSVMTGISTFSKYGFGPQYSGNTAIE